jgi:outer membrane protein assembly factor BamC
VIEDQNRNQGLYVVEYRELVEDSQEEGFLSNLAFWRQSPPPEEGSRYQVRVGARDSKTLVMVYNTEGQPDGSPAAQRILGTMQEIIE